jgi:serine acetyltransferase
MLKRLRKATEQLGHLVHEVRELNGKSWWRWGNVWFSSSFWAVASYRMNRAGYLALGPGWSAARVVLAPVLFGARPWTGQCEIHYRAEIGRGLRVLHPTLGVVVSADTIAGKNLVLVGGNCIGRRQTSTHAPIRIGDNVLLGANACVIGPLTIGEGVRIGAGAVVARDADPGTVLLASRPTIKPAT